MNKYLNLGVLGGVNLRQDPTAIGDNQWTKTQNVFPVKPGLLGLRPAMQFERRLYEFDPGLIAFPDTLGDWPSMSRRNGIVYSSVVPGGLPAVPIDFEFARLGGEFVIAYIDPTTGIGWLDVLPKSTLDPAPMSLGEITQRPTLLVWNNRVYCFTGNDGGWVVAQDAADPRGFSIQPFLFQNDASKPQLAAVRNGRFYFGQFGDDRQNQLWWSEVNQPTLLTGSGDHGNLVNGYNLAFPDKLTAIADLATTAAGSPQQSALFVFTRNQTYQILGEPGSNSDLTPNPGGTMQVTRLNTVAGCVSGATICQTPYGALWAGEDDVWLMAFGSVPVRVGSNIRPALLETPAALRWKWHAVYDNGIYKLAVFAPGQGPNTFSPCQHQWWLDLRDGAPQGADDAKWWGPQVYVPTSTDNQGTFCMRQDTRPGAELRVFGLANFRFGIPAPAEFGYGHQGVTVVSFDGKSTRDTCAPQAQTREWIANTAYNIGDWIAPTASETRLFRFRVTTAGTTGVSRPNFAASLIITDGTVTWAAERVDPVDASVAGSWENPLRQTGNEIVPVLSGKEFLMDGGFDKLFEAIELGYWCSQPVQLQVTRGLDYDRTTTTTLVEPGQFQAGVSLLSSTGPRIQRLWGSRLLAPNPGQRSVANSLRVDITHVPGIYLAAEESVLGCYNPDNDTLLVFQVPPGWYAGPNALGTAFFTAFAAAVTAASTASGWKTGNGGAPVTANILVLNYHDWFATIGASSFPATYFPWSGGQTNIPSCDIQPSSALTAFAPTDAGIIYANRAFFAKFGFDIQHLRADTSQHTLCYPTLNPDIQINTLKARYRSFGRRPV